ncbi:unnamed protein product, partial [Didymodactylos carnosus]
KLSYAALATFGSTSKRCSVVSLKVTCELTTFYAFRCVKAE